MPRRPIRARNEGSSYNLVIRIPGRLKNEILDHCAGIDAPINSWVVSVLLEALRDARGLPPPPPAAAPLPTIDEVLRSYVLGERIIMPCGQPGPCAGENPVKLGGIDYCPECSIRVR